MTTAEIYSEFEHDLPARGERYEFTVWADASVEARALDINTREVLWQRRVVWESVSSAQEWGIGGMVLRYGYGL